MQVEFLVQNVNLFLLSPINLVEIPVEHGKSQCDHSIFNEDLRCLSVATNLLNQQFLEQEKEVFYTGHEGHIPRDVEVVPTQGSGQVDVQELLLPVYFGRKVLLFAVHNIPRLETGQNVAGLLIFRVPMLIVVIVGDGFDVEWEEKSDEVFRWVLLFLSIFIKVFERL